MRSLCWVLNLIKQGHVDTEISTPKRRQCEKTQEADSHVIEMVDIWQHSFELGRSGYMWIFSINACCASHSVVGWICRCRTTDSVFIYFLLLDFGMHMTLGNNPPWIPRNNCTYKLKNAKDFANECQNRGIKERYSTRDIRENMALGIPWFQIFNFQSSGAINFHYFQSPSFFIFCYGNSRKLIYLL